jgi:hypothetical protein
VVQRALAETERNVSAAARFRGVDRESLERGRWGGRGTGFANEAGSHLPSSARPAWFASLFTVWGRSEAGSSPPRGSIPRVRGSPWLDREFGTVDEVHLLK